MPWFNLKSKKLPQEIKIPRLHFLGEQDGIPERELKTHLIDLLQQDASILTAYLARVTYNSVQSSIFIALCFRAQFDADRRIAEKAGNIFTLMFGEHEHLDIIFLDDQQEHELSKVCLPFFIGHKKA